MMPIHSAPIPCDRVPFANERELQRFIIANAAELFEAEVVATSLRDGRTLYGIDILAVDGADRVLVMECKWDAIDASAISQLLNYKDALLADRAAVEERIAQELGRFVQLVSPVLVAIGYRCESALRPEPASVETLIYKYPGDSFARLVEHQAQGLVQLTVSAESDHRLTPHPEVLKTRYAKARTAALPPKLRDAFWTIDTRLRSVDGILPKYSGKEAHAFVTYRRGRRAFATASIGTESIIWRCTVGRHPDNFRTIEMDVRSQSDEILRMLLRYAHDAV